MTRNELAALLISLVALFAAALVANEVFENIPHLEDEIAYVWQAKVMARGEVTLPTPEHSRSFLVPFVVDYGGKRFGKYPLGWPALLSIAIHLNAREWINPFLAGLGVWLTFRLGKKLFGGTVSLLAALLTASSPFFLMNSGSLLSHPFGFVLSTAFALGWLDTFCNASFPRKNLSSLVAGLSLGTLAITRPFTALAVALPFALHGAILLVRGDRTTRRRVLVVGGLALAVASLNLLWQYEATGDPFFNLYTLWWPYDKVGFGAGFGVTEQGHNLELARINTRFSLWVGYHDLFGWGAYSWIFLPIGLVVILLRRNWQALMISSVFVSLVVFHLAYWVGSWLFGPRYYYEGLYSLTLLTALAIASSAGWQTHPDIPGQHYRGWKKVRPLLTFALLLFLLATNLLFYTPTRLNLMRGLYGMERSDLEPFLVAEKQGLTPALIIVHPERWMPYGVLLDLQSPYLDSPFIFAYSRGARADAALAADFPDRKVFHYYPDEPYRFYTAPRPNP